MKRPFGSGCFVFIAEALNDASAACGNSNFCPRFPDISADLMQNLNIELNKNT
jgi:hypothetical protein